MKKLRIRNLAVALLVLALSSSVAAAAPGMPSWVADLLVKVLPDVAVEGFGGPVITPNGPEGPGPIWPFPDSDVPVTTMSGPEGPGPIDPFVK